MTTRTFETKQATRTQVPLLIGLVSPSGAGKTYSALRLASGIQRVVGGDICIIDTESRRGLHYADRFNYKHVEFGAPFGPLDYLAAIEHCYKGGAKTIIVDSSSHEHEGPGGVLEMHEQECQRMMREWSTSREKVQLGAWSKPKQERRRLINSMLQIPCNFILCFRAKEKLKVEAGKPPVQLGWMPIGGEEWLFEMTMNCLLYPNAGGVPMWKPNEPAERQMLKLPEQFRNLMMDKFANQPLNEEIGEALARWAAGGNVDPGSEVRQAIREAASSEQLRALKPRIDELREKKLVPGPEFKAIMDLAKARSEEIAALSKASGDYGDAAGAQ